MMKGELHPVLSEGGHVVTASTSDYFVTTKENPNGGSVVSVMKVEDDDSESNSEEAILISTSPKGASFGSIAALDSQSKTMFATLEDEKRLAAFPLPETSKVVDLSNCILDLKFHSPIIALHILRNRIKDEGSNIAVAISEVGEIAVSHFSSRTQTTDAMKTFPQEVEKVSHVAIHNDEYVVMLCEKEKHIVFWIVKLGSCDKFESLSVDILPGFLLPRPASVPCDKVLGFTIEEGSATLLFEGGFVNVISPAEHSATDGNHNVDTWFKARATSDGSKEGKATKIRSSFRIASGLLKYRSSDGKHVSNVSEGKSGSVARLGGGYFAIGYGRYVSVWDNRYCMGHALVPLSEQVHVLSEGNAAGNVLITFKDSIKLLTFGDGEKMPVLSLGSALKRKGVCDEIVEGVEAELDSSTLRSHPLITAPLKAAAEGVGDIERIFSKVINKEEEADAKRVRVLLQRRKTPTASAICEINKDFVTEKYPRGPGCPKKGRNAVHALKIPSERVAAVTVARCLYEIAHGDDSFLIPMIDMVGTGVVSATAVLECLDVSEAWAMGSNGKEIRFSSIIDPLIGTNLHVNGLEALLTQVVDFAEEDVLRILQLGVRVMRQEKSQDQERRTRMHKLLLKCMTCKVDRSRIIQLIRQLPFGDVNELLSFFNDMLVKQSEQSQNKVKKRNGIVRKKMQLDSGILYRGHKNWLDRDYAERIRVGEVDEMEGMLSWACCVVDAHLVTLILDREGSEMAVRLWKTVQSRREECEMLRGIQSLTRNVMEKQAIPSLVDESYKMEVVQVPSYAALL